MEKVSKKPVLAVVGSAIILTVGLGSTSLLNAIAVLLVEGMNTDLVAYSLGPMLATIFAFLGSLVGSKLIMKITPRWCLLIGTICVTIALVLFASATSPLMWYIGNIINGIVLAIGAHASVAGVLSEYYGERTPTIFGIVAGIMGFAIAGLVLIESFFLQLFDYRTILYGYAAVVFVLGVFSNFVLIGKTPSQIKRKEGEQSPVAQAKEEPQESPAQAAVETTGLTLQQAVKSPVLYVFFIAMVFASFPLNGFSAFTSNFLVGGGLDPAFAVTLLSLFALMVAVVSMFSGGLSKKLGASITSAIVFIGFAIGIVFLVIWVGNGVLPLAFVGLVCCALIGPVQILPALFIPQLFGMKDYTSINAVGMSAFYLGGAAVFLIAAAIMQNIGYSMGFIVLAASGVIALALFLLSVRISPVARAARIAQKEKGVVSPQATKTPSKK